MKRVIALGFFDGVHMGHGALLKKTADRAKELGAVATALTFDGRPEGLITGHDIPLIVTPPERVDLMRRLYGIEEAIVVHFDEGFMHMPWRDFVKDKLIGEYGAAHVVAGHDYHFGYKGEGNPSRLIELCAACGIGCDIIERVELDGITVSSTYIRKLIAQGEVATAGRFLGRAYSLSGVVMRGNNLGTALGFPTVNIGVPDGLQSPGFGVYATHVTAKGERYAAVTNIGVRPTVVSDGPVLVESTLFSFDGDLYGESITVEFDRKIRDERKFASVEALKKQIERDARTAKKLHGITGEEVPAAV